MLSFHTPHANTRKNLSPSATSNLTSFTIGGDEYAIESRHVMAVVPWKPAEKLPNSPTYVLGAMVHNGVRLPVLELHAPFATTRPAADGTIWVLILRRMEDTIGLVVDHLENADGSSEACVRAGLGPMQQRRSVMLSHDRIFELTRADMVAHLVNA